MAERKNEAIWIQSQSRWQIKVQMDGVRRTFTSSKSGRKGKVEAERKADKWLEEQTVNENTKCEVLIDKFYEHVKATSSKGNWRPMGSRIENHIKPLIGAKKIGRLTENDLQEVLDAAYKKGLSKRGIKNVKSDLTAIIKYCRKANATRLFPESLYIPNGAKRSKKTVADPDDIRKLFESDKTTWKGKVCSDRYIHAYRFAVVSGLRLGELLGLKWEDIKGKKLRIRRALNDDNIFTEGKNENARRTLILTGLALEEIEQQRKLLRQEGILSPYVFPTRKGTPTSQDTFRSNWKRYYEHNGMKKVTPYELRHTYVSVNKEMPEGLKRLLVGHSEDMDTEGTYGHEMAGDLARAAEYSDAAFREILAKKA